MQCKSDGITENGVTENNHSTSPVAVESQEAKTSDSAENFQRFMYELFEKNGVINDLRAYLRGHIVGVLRSAQTGDPPACQKHFTQRLELPFQALNVLIAEYLLRLEFSYTLSVFVSEIPLANMVFAFTKSLMKNNNSDTKLRFKDQDVWSVLNYLGIKCDSDHASNIVEMYKREKHSPLLHCMLKCMTLYKQHLEVDKVELSQESLSSSIRSSDTLDEKTRSHRTPSAHDKCKHYVLCKTCQCKMMTIKEKYKKKKKNLTKNVKESIELKPQNVESLMKNIDVMERNLIDEMFQQLKSVYETEMEMIKSEEENRVKRSLETHAVQLQRKRAEMEEQFKAREAELESNVQKKKRFLWGLARLLREQHQQMTRAMQDVRAETSRLAAKEDSLKSQLAEAEKILRQRGEDMRHQISNELVILEGHLESMKKERDSINKERSELEHIKHLCDSSAKTIKIETNNEDLRSHYDLLKNEFIILKKYLETAKLQPKCVIERSTMTELGDVTSRIDVVLNNGHDVERNSSEDKFKDKQVVNDLKKSKNVNFSQSNLAEIYRERSCSRPSRSPSTASSEAGGAGGAGGTLERLREENDRLRTFATQQREHIDELSSQQARLQAELTAARLPRGAAAAAFRPRTAPTAMPDANLFMQRMSSSASTNNLSHGWRKGAGEELSFFTNAQPRIVVPGDTLPFIGVIRERHNDNRRYLINQWRSLRRRVSPIGGVGKARAPSPGTRDVNRERANSAGPSVRIPSEEDLNINESQMSREYLCYRTACELYEQRPKTAEARIKNREQNTKSVLREAKEKLRSKDYNLRSPITRENSPNTVLRDAKLRLRKLEIEAQAVEKSYLDFRRKQDAMKNEKKNAAKNYVDSVDIKELDLVQNKPSPKVGETRTDESTSHYNRLKTLDLNTYMKEYYTKYDISETHYKNKNAISEQVKPIPPAFTYETASIQEKNKNYLETPLTEFRKYYHSEKRVVVETRLDDHPKTYSERTFIDKSRLEDRPKTPLNRNVDIFESDTCPRSPIFINSGMLSDRDGPKSPTRNRDISESNYFSRPPVSDGPKTSINKNRDNSNSCSRLAGKLCKVRVRDLLYFPKLV